MAKKPAEVSKDVTFRNRDLMDALSGCRVLERNEDEAWDYRDAQVGSLNIDALQGAAEAYGKQDRKLQRQYGQTDRTGNLVYDIVGDSRILRFAKAADRDAYEAAKETLDNDTVTIRVYLLPNRDGRTFIDELEESNYRGDLGFLRGIRDWILQDAPEAEEDAERRRRREDREAREAAMRGDEDRDVVKIDPVPVD